MKFEENIVVLKYNKKDLLFPWKNKIKPRSLSIIKSFINLVCFLITLFNFNRISKPLSLLTHVIVERVTLSFEMCMEKWNHSSYLSSDPNSKVGESLIVERLPQHYRPLQLIYKYKVVLKQIYWNKISTGTNYFVVVLLHCKLWVNFKFKKSHHLQFNLFVLF